MKAGTDGGESTALAGFYGFILRSGLVETLGAVSLHKSCPSKQKQPSRRSLQNLVEVDLDEPSLSEEEATEREAEETKTPEETSLEIDSTSEIRSDLVQLTEESKDSESQSSPQQQPLIPLIDTGDASQLAEDAIEDGSSAATRQGEAPPDSDSDLET